jgi:site-specific recombinase XerD
LKPYYGQAITDIDETVCLKIIATAKANSKDASNNKISATMWSELHQLFTWCRERNIITQDPTLLITRPKYSSKAQQKNEINIDRRIAMGKWLLDYTSSHIDAHSTDYGMILCGSMGLRAGEIRGLEWKCFQHLLDRQFDRTVLIVQQIYDRNLKTKQWELQRWTKSNAKGYRELAVPRAWCENFFNFYIYEQDNLFNEFHLPYDYDSFCFLTEQGKPFNKNQQQKRWNDLKEIYIAEHPKTAEIDKDMRIHDMRHVIASLLIEGGATLEQVKPILGHMDKNTTDYYTHLSQKFSRATMDKIPSLLGHGDNTLGFFNTK